MDSITVNGTHPRGRIVPDFPTFTTSAGYVLHVRRLSPDTPSLFYQAAAKELESEKPIVPTQRVATGPGAEADIPRPNDPEYVKALAAWETQVRRIAANKMLKLLTDYAIVDELDQAQVDAFKALNAELGLTYNETDRQIWLWRIIAPGNQDQIDLLAFALGVSAPSAEAIQAQKAAFRGDVPGAGHLDPADAQGPDAV